MPPLLLFLLLLLHSLSSPSLARPSLSSDAFALLAFKSNADSTNSLRFFFNGSSGYDAHCSWHGVQCSPQSRVTKLVLESCGLDGSFADKTLSRLDQLRILSLKGNFLAGPLPDLSHLINLKALYLDHNLFNGSFPKSLFALHRLRTLDLSHNRLVGEIPVKVASLDRLYYLRLDSNSFNGSIPPLNQTSLKIFNVSSNELSGAVPATEALKNFDASAFSGNPRLCGKAVRRECRSHFLFFYGGNGVAPAPAVIGGRRGQLDDKGILFPDSGSGRSSRKFHKWVLFAIGLLALAFVLVGFVAILIGMKSKRRRMRQGKILTPEKSLDSHMESASNNVINPIDEIETSNTELVVATTMSEEKVKKLGKSGCLIFCAGEAQIYTLEQLMRGSAELLGKGSVGSTYKAVLDNRLIVSVKRLDATKMGAMGKEVFERHMDAVGRLRHPNLVPLRAFFQAKEERLLVYDYQPNGSLFALLHGSRSTRAKPLHWTSCLKIAEDIAQGLSYIHQASRLVHGNLKSSNVLLGMDFEACLTDSCLLTLVEPSSSSEEYRAPEIRNNQRLTPRSDIYAFGVLLLELLSGKPPLRHSALVATDLAAWVQNVRDDEGDDEERIMMIVEIAAACVRSSPEGRPTTWQVLKMIQEVKGAAEEGHDNDSALIP